MNEVNTDEYKYLQRAYNRFAEYLKAKKKWTGNSLLSSILNIKSNDRLKLLIDFSLSSTAVPKSVLQSLRNNGYIRPAGSTEKFALTAAAIIAIEKKAGIDPIETLIKTVDEKFFLDVFSFKGQALSHREKIILLTLILFRSFSEESALDIKRDERARDSIQKTFIKAANFLEKEKLIPHLSDKDLFGELGNEHPISNVFRHSDALPKKTYTLFQSSKKRNQSYYLDLLKNDEISTKDMGYVLWLIFREKLSIVLFDELDVLCRSVLSEYGIIVFENIDSSFYHPKYNDLLKHGFEEYMNNKDLWE
jgi:hypothetical protein